MAKDLLLEIGLEEVPARFIRKAVQQLQEKITNWLSEARIGYGDVYTYATPRRLAVHIRSVQEQQEDLEEEVKGPAKKIAITEEGSWSKAALGFARSQGVNPEDLIVKDLGGTEYIFAVKHHRGVKTETLLGEALTDLIKSMTFPKNMRWGHHELTFVRPIRWLVALFGEDVIPLNVANVSSDRTTKGHRFLGNQEIHLPSAQQYVSMLQAEFVIADIEDRKQSILKQIETLSAEKGWHIAIHDDLLEEVLFLVEYPTVLYGRFDEAFLHIPQEVLITSMREHQRYFPVMDDQGQLLPYFVTVRNGDMTSSEQVVKGNEKVLRARLSDARFFYEEDQKGSIDACLERLEKIVFHEELGSIGDKVRRIVRISERMASLLDLDADTVNKILRTATICKFDLVTQMVYEFPELQGVMGEDYAQKFGEDEAVARAIFEHYQPRFSGDESPQSRIGAVVSIADKIDTIVGCISIGIIPTGSQDPYALRRQAAGIVQILHDHQFRCSIDDLIQTALDVYKNTRGLKRNEEEIRKDVLDFFALRVKHLLSEHFKYDVVDAVMASGFSDIPAVVQKGRALTNSLEKSDLKTIVESFNRVHNLAVRASSTSYDTSLFTESVEHQLANVWEQIKSRYVKELQSGDVITALETISELKQPITDYFDQVMVMVEDEKIRENRLALLADIAQHLDQFADFQKLVW